MPAWPWDGISQADYGPPSITVPTSGAQIYGVRNPIFGNVTSPWSRTSTLGEVPNSSYTLWYLKDHPVTDADPWDFVVNVDNYNWSLTAALIPANYYLACRADSVDGHYSRLSANIQFSTIFYPAPTITIPTDGQKIYTASVAFERSSTDGIFQGSDSQTHWFFNKGSPPLISGPNDLASGRTFTKIFVAADVGTWYVAVRSRGNPWVSAYSAVSSFVLSPTPSDFSASPTNFLESKTVQFQDLTSGSPTSWSWKFRASDSGDAWVEFSTLQNPTKDFSV